MDDVSHLKSVNWTTGMLLAPDHFRRQDAFLEETVGWLLRYCVPPTGLVGGGVRVPSGERGMSRFDPRVELSDDGNSLGVAVLEARGLTSLGQLVDIGRGNIIRHNLRRSDLAGVDEVLIYVVVGGEREEDPESIGIDDANPTQAAYRRAAFAVQLGCDADTLPRALCVGRVRRAAESLAFELDAQFIPACATALGHSQLYAAWQRLHSAVVTLAADFALLHRSCAEYTEQLAQRVADVSHDRDVLAFIERAVLGMDHCAYETFDPTIAPAAFFREIDRVGRRIALALDLSSGTRRYLAELGQADSDYGVLLEEERGSLERPRDLGSNADLQRAIDGAVRTVERMRRLVDALDARYTDFRLSRAVESLKFLLDSDGERFFVTVSTPVYPQRRGDLLTFMFGQLSLAARQPYRLVFVADGIAAPWQPGESFRVDVSVNPGAANAVISGTVACVLPDQRNFSFDFEADDTVSAISALQVTVQPGLRLRTCILYQRRRGMRGGALMRGDLPVSAPAAAAAPIRPVPLPPPAANPPPPPPEPKQPIVVTWKKADPGKK